MRLMVMRCSSVVFVCGNSLSAIHRIKSVSSVELKMLVFRKNVSGSCFLFSSVSGISLILDRQATFYRHCSGIHDDLHAMPESLALFGRVGIRQETHLARYTLDGVEMVLIP